MRSWLLIAAIIVITPRAFALGQLGHEAVCGIAESQLLPVAKKQVTAIAQRAGYDSFAASCRWADDVKGEERWQFTQAHHYVNFKRSATNVDAPLRCKITGCIGDAILAHQKRLLGQPLSRLEKKLYPASRDQALLFLAHFVGDIHQPLHVSFSDDHGGNRHNLSYRGEKINLHWLWDDLLLPRESWQQMARRLTRGNDSQHAPILQQDSVMQWQSESFALTREIYQTLPANRRIDDSYVSRYRPQLEQRIRQAGHRLAAMLNEIYAAEAPAAVQ